MGIRQHNREYYSLNTVSVEKFGNTDDLAIMRIGIFSL